MTGSLTEKWLGDGKPFCVKCNRMFDEIEVRYGNKTLWTEKGPLSYDTGERVVIVTCHGETLAISNQQGQVSPDYEPWRD